MKIRNILYATTVGLALSILTPLGGMSLALAGNDMKTYPGSSCQPADSTSRQAIQYLVDGGVTNTSSDKDIQVLCSVIRDNTSSSLRYVAIYYEDNHPQRQFYCSVSVLRNREGESGRLYRGKGKYSPVGIERKGSIGLAGLPRVSSGYYSMLCRIPRLSASGAKSMLYTYWVDEND